MGVFLAWDVGFYCFVYLFHGFYGFVQGDDFVSERFNCSVLDLVLTPLFCL